VKKIKFNTYCFGLALVWCSLLCQADSIESSTDSTNPIVDESSWEGNLEQPKVQSLPVPEKKKLEKDLNEALKDPNARELEKIENQSTKSVKIKVIAKPIRLKRRFNNVSVLRWFTVGAGIISDSDGGFWGTTSLGWTPNFVLNRSLRLKAQLGVTGLNFFTKGTFFAIDGFGGVVYSGANPLLVDLGGGVQYWTNKKGFIPQLRLGLGYRIRGFGGYLHSINLSYSRLFDSLLSSNMVTVSLGLKF